MVATVCLAKPEVSFAKDAQIACKLLPWKFDQLPDAAARGSSARIDFFPELACELPYRHAYIRFLRMRQHVH